MASESMHSVGNRRERRPSADGGSMSARKASKGGGIFGRVNPTEHARDVERMNAEVRASVHLFAQPHDFSRLLAFRRFTCNALSIFEWEGLDIVQRT